MKKYLLIKTLALFLLFYFGTTNLYSQTFCCCAAAGCVENPLAPGNDCSFWCDFIGAGANAGDAAGYTAGCPGSSCEIVPVETTFFKGKVIRDNQVQLTWQTASEIDNEGFEIQRANADFKWEFLDFEKGNGNSTETIDYFFVDKTPYPGTNYYRFKQIDFDGNHEFSKVVVIDVKNIKGDVTIFPTLAKERLLIKFAEEPAELPTYRVFDLMGRKVIETIAQNGVLDISGLDTGQYVVSFLLSGTLRTEKFFKIN